MDALTQLTGACPSCSTVAFAPLLGAASARLQQPQAAYVSPMEWMLASQQMLSLLWQLMLGSTSPAAPAAESYTPTGGTETGRRLAQEALRESTDGDSPGGWCARDVKAALAEIGIQLPRGDAWTMAAVLARHPRFREIQVSRAQLPNLPPGAIVIWERTASMPWGHASIALGDGREASDKLKTQAQMNSPFRVFMPI